MTKVFLEYVWLDGNQPQQLRSKTKVVNGLSKIRTYDELNNGVWSFPKWSFDGSSTKQAKAGKGENTDCILKPVFSCNDPFRPDDNHYIVFCEVFNPNGTIHPTNRRGKLREFMENNKMNDSKEDLENANWFGWEQEYTLTTKPDFKDGEGLPLGFRPNSEPRPQGDYYCGVGADNVTGRKIVEKHLNKCAEAGLEISGINAEVMLGQWEYQIGPVTPLNGSDQLWVSRYILQRVAEENGVKISYHPKPKTGDWNGSGCHVNFSSPKMREEGGISFIKEAVNKLSLKHVEHMDVYGLYNEERMTGEHETSTIHDFSYGYSTRDTSIRIPAQSSIDGKGYFEDRRPASNCDPYSVSLRMLKTVYNEVEKPMEVNELINEKG
jgi:glutamine synthetase